MSSLKNKFLSLIDNGANQAKTMIDDFNELINSFDFDSSIDYFKERKKSLLEKSEELFSEFSNLMKQVKESFTDFSVTVPFDEEGGEKIAYDVKDGKLNIEVSYEDETSTKNNKTCVLLPENCDLDNISFKNNNLAKTATITVPKKIVEDGENEGEKDEETVANKLARKLQHNADKYKNILKRDSRGRFVRRQPN